MNVFSFVFHVHKWCLQWYKSNSFIRWGVDCTMHLWDCMGFCFAPHDVEPTTDWYSVSYLVPTPVIPFSLLARRKDEDRGGTKYKYKLVEKLYSLNKLQNFPFSPVATALSAPLCPQLLYVDLFHRNEDISEDEEDQRLVIVKYKGNHNVRKVDKKMILHVNKEKSNVHFLTVQYFHEKQSINPITLDIPKSMYLVGNELLTPTFVLRCLKYQSTPFYFDLNYTVKIIDDKIQMFELKYDEYIVLEKNGYKINCI